MSGTGFDDLRRDGKRVAGDEHGPGQVPPSASTPKPGHAKTGPAGKTASGPRPNNVASVIERRVFLRTSRKPTQTIITERCFLSACSPRAQDGSGNRGFVDSLAPNVRIGEKGNQCLRASVRRHRSIEHASCARRSIRPKRARVTLIPSRRTYGSSEALPQFRYS
jgi:hypothetical protein